MAVEELYEKACDAVERANYDYAVELFREVLRQDPDFLDARIALRGTERRRAQERGRSIGLLMRMPLIAMATAVKGALSGAVKRLEAYEDFLKDYPDSFFGLMGAAAALRKAGHLDQAIIVYKDAQRIKPDNKRVLRALTDGLVQAGASREALRYAERLLAMAPRSRDLQREVRNLQASGHMEAHGLETATSFRDLIRDKDIADQLEQEGRVVATKEDLAEKVGQAEQELAAEPKSTANILRLADLYVETGRLAKARKLLLVKHEELKGDYDVRAKLGDLQMTVYDQAIATMRKALEQDPDDGEAREKLDDLVARRKRFAVKEYQARLEMHPTDRDIQMNLAKAYFDVGQYNEAIASFQETLSDPRHGLESARMLGECFAAKGQYDLALEQYERAIKFHPALDDAGKALQYSLAGNYEAMGSKEEALAIYKKIYSSDINYRDVAEKVDTLSG